MSYDWDVVGAVILDMMGQIVPAAEVDLGYVPMSQISKGDANEDGIINSLDAVLGVRMVLGLQDETWAADYDADGRVKIEDILLMVGSILGSGACPP